MGGVLGGQHHAAAPYRRKPIARRTDPARDEQAVQHGHARKYHEQFLDCWKRLGISFDLFTTTGTANHARVTQDIFLTLLNKGLLYTDSVLQAYGLGRLTFGPDYIIPKPFDPRLRELVPAAVARAAIASGVARLPYPAHYS